MNKKRISISVAVALTTLGVIIYYLIVINKPVIVFPNENSWYYIQVVSFKHYDYKVTKKFIKEHDVNKRLCGIMYNGNGTIPATQYDLYSIKHINNYDKIAIKTKYGFLIASKGKYDKWQ